MILCLSIVKKKIQKQLVYDCSKCSCIEINFTNFSNRIFFERTSLVAIVLWSLENMKKKKSMRFELHNNHDQ